MQRTPLLLVITLGAMFTVAIAVCVVLAKQGHPAEALLGAVLVLIGAASTVAALARPVPSVPLQPLEDLQAKVDELSDTLREMAAHNALSPDARRVLFRKQERDLLLQAIEEDIAESQWDAALVLVAELESRLGYTLEATALRARVETARARPVPAEQRAQPDAPAPATGGNPWPVDPVPDTPESPQAPASAPPAPEGPVITVPVTDEARAATKLELERRFMAAAADGRAEAAMSILAELDQYLTPSEAEPLREIARGVIAKTRDSLGEQFKAAVQGRRWHEAISVGEQIIGRFPNTRMASEVRDVMDALRSRA
ncbi:MAG: hypothetical protein U0637_15655 [Phycisphaerales bacterium]